MNFEEDQSSKRSCSEREKVHKTFGSSLRRSVDDNNTSSSCNSTDATKEYEDAMKSLRRKPTALPSSPVSVFKLSYLTFKPLRFLTFLVSLYKSNSLILTKTVLL